MVDKILTTVTFVVCAVILGIIINTPNDTELNSVAPITTEVK